MSDNNPVIAIIGGTGKEGSGLALRWARVGCKIIIGSRQKEKAQTTSVELNRYLGSEFITGMDNREAARQADICVLTVVKEAHEPIVEGLKDELCGKIVVDTTARVDFSDPKPPAPPCTARIAQDILGDSASVVAAFQNVPAGKLRKNIGQSIDADVLICADDIPAAQKVIALAQEAGMRGIYAGRLDNAIVVEGLTSLLISINKYYGAKAASIRVSGLPE